MIKIKRVYDPPSKDDGKRVLVDRLWPRGLSKEDAQAEEWIRDIAPSDELRRWFSHDPSRWADFRKKYKDELKTKLELLDRLRNEAEKRTLTLLFGAKDAKQNNAAVLKEVLEGKGDDR